MFYSSKLIRKILPQSLFGRFLLIILIPNIIVQLVAIYVFYERHWSGVSKHMAVALAGDINMVVRSIVESPSDNRDEIIRLAEDNMYLDVVFKKDTKLGDVPVHEPVVFSVLLSELDKRLPMQHVVYYKDDDKSDVAVDVQLDDGLLHITSSSKRLANPSTYIFIMWMTGTAVLFLLISVFFMRNQVRSISRLAIVADKFGKGHDSEGFKPSGALEVRRAGKAFIEMKKRINKQVEQRTEMLAGVSHDLKTPLTRIKLQLAMMKQDKEIKELQDDVVEMEKMVQGYLDFAKGKERVIDATVNVSDLLRSIIAGYRNYHRKIELKSASGILLHVNSNALRRAITNIIDNALRYGEVISINMTSSKKNMILTIDDDGPGIPVKKRVEVFKPFYRLDSSRHIESGSTGLGLSIAKDIIVGYGGDITLDDSPIGGLRVVIKLPL